ncbi:MAG: NAD-dependent epimerase/dehydratase family protein [Chloroflexota bacterium]|nr:MAG: NAD-dependent epimerase/dehydratase family protein [Chloroflexota bacterium]
MAETKVVLVTGVAGYWGAKVAAQLVANPGFHVLGIDQEKLEQEIKGLDFIQADIRNPLLGELLKSEGVDTVCHLATIESAQPNEAAFDFNIMGTAKVFGACAQAGVKKIVTKSTTAVYGAHPTNSAFLREEHPLKGSTTYGYTRDMIEIEAFCNGFRLQVPDILLTVLRFPSIVGPTADTPMTRFLKEPLIPVLLGFDPMMQVIHEDDVTGALVNAIVNDVPGIFNVAAEGVVPLSKLIALAGKIPLPVFHLFAYWGASFLGSSKMKSLSSIPIELDYIRYAWVGDIARMRDEMQFMPHYTAEEALREFAGYQRMSIYKTDSANLAYDEERLRDTIERRRRAAERKPTVTGENEPEMEGVFDE